MYSEATDALDRFASSTGMPVAETQAGKGALPFDHPQAIGAIGRDRHARRESPRARRGSGHGVGSRLSDFTERVEHGFRRGRRAVRVDQRGRARRAANTRSLALVGDARASLTELESALEGWRVKVIWAAYPGRARPLDARGRPHLYTRSPAAHQPGRSHRHPERLYRSHRRRRLRRGQLARRPAQAVADENAGRIPPGIRLFDDGV